MSTNNKSCHGQFDCMQNSSTSMPLNFLFRKAWKLKTVWFHMVWHLKNKGFAQTSKLTLSKITKPVHTSKSKERISTRSTKNSNGEILNLKPNELVEVRSEQEILQTLNAKKRHKGLLWMAGMRKYCGKRYKVFKRLDTILLESNGELRKMKNTVLLESVMCDGYEFFGCDRSCFHYWREAWLKRVEPN